MQTDEETQPPPQENMQSIFHYLVSKKSVGIR
jgi:hypothetical protein